jgi:hypothetical protein
LSAARTGDASLRDHFTEVAEMWEHMAAAIQKSGVDPHPAAAAPKHGLDSIAGGKAN